MTATSPSEVERQEEAPKKAKNKPEPKKRQVRSYMSELAQAQQLLREVEHRIAVAIDLLEPEKEEPGSGASVPMYLVRKAIRILRP